MSSSIWPRGWGWSIRSIELARSALTWSERAHAVRLLGKLAVANAVPPLSAILRDRYEDAAVRTAAAEALGNLHESEAIPALAAELSQDDESACPVLAEALVRFGDQATPELLRVLEMAGHPAARVWAARILGRTADATAVEPLIARLRDRHEMLRIATCEALGHLTDKRALMPLTQIMLRDPSPQVRAHAAGALSEIAGEQAAGVLVTALSDPDYATRLRAIEAFENMHLSDISALQRALNDANVEVRRRAAVALERSGRLEQLIDQLSSADRAIVASAYVGVLELGAAGLVEGIAGWLRHESMQVRALIAKACGELGIARIGPMLVAGLDDPAWPVRASVCEAIRRLRPKGSVPMLVRLLSDSEEVVRESAGAALCAFSSTEVMPFENELASAYENGSIPIRLSMVELAAHLNGAAMTQLIMDATRDPSEAVRLRAVQALGSRTSPASVSALIGTLTDPSFDVRLAAVPALGAAGTAEAFEALLRALPGAPPDFRELVADVLSGIGRTHLLSNAEMLAHSENLDVRLGIAWTLGKIGDPVGVPILSTFLREAEPRLRASAAGALGKIPSPEALDVLVGAAGDRDPKTRAAAVNAIGKVGKPDPKAIVALERRLQDPDGFVRNRAGIALARVAGPEALRACTDPKTVRLLDDAVVVVMQGLVGSEETVPRAMEYLLDTSKRAKLQKFLDKEERAIRSQFYSGLRLSEQSRMDSQAPLDPVAFAAEYSVLLRSSQDVSKRRAAVDALGRLSSASNVMVFAEALMADPDEIVRLRCARTLHEHLDDPTSRKALLVALADPSEQVALEAIRGLRQRREPEVGAALYARMLAGTPRSNDAIEEALAQHYQEDPVAFIDLALGAGGLESTIGATRVLARIATPAAFPILRQLARSSDSRLRAAAVRAIGSIPHSEAGALVGSMLDDPDDSVRIAVLEAIAAEGPKAIVRLGAARIDPSIQVRQRLAELLERFSGAAACKLLEPLLQDTSARVRAAAMTSLLGLADPESLKRFAACWKQASPEVRLAVQADARAEGIARKLATSVLSTVDPAVREAAVSGIGALAASGFEEHLLPVLSDPKSSVRLAAACALASSRSAEVRKRLGDLLDDPDTTVREAMRQVFVHSVR